MNALSRLLPSAVALALLFAAAGAAPASGVPAAGLPLMLAQAEGPTLREAVEQVRRQYNGRIVSAETRVQGNRVVHHIKVLTDDGKVKTVRIPGGSRRG